MIVRVQSELQACGVIQSLSWLHDCLLIIEQLSDRQQTATTTQVASDARCRVDELIQKLAGVQLLVP